MSAPVEIESDGTTTGTSIKVNGEFITATALTYELDASTGFARLSLTVEGASLDLAGDVEVIVAEEPSGPWSCTADQERDGRCVGPNVDPAHAACPGLVAEQ